MAGRSGARATVGWWSAWFAAGAALGLLACATWWVVLANDLAPGDHFEELVIPAGTANAIASGAPFAFVDSQLSLSAGGVLRVVNRDSVSHQVGGTTIPANATADIEATESGAFACTIHPAGELDVTLVSRPPLAGMALIVLALSLGAGTVGWLLRTDQ